MATDLAWYRHELQALDNAALTLRTLDLYRIECAHGDDASSAFLDECGFEMSERGLAAEYERVRQHVRAERAKGRGHILPFEVTAMTTALSTRQDSGQLAASCGALSPAALVDQVRLIQQAMADVMIDGQHYGKIPGCGDKPTLLKPGAEKLAFLFRLALEIEEQVVEMGGGHREYRVKCRLRSIQGGHCMGEGIGCCSTMESKYRWRKAERVCPSCDKAAIIKGKEEYGGGWLCWKKKDGCGAQFAEGDRAIESQQVGRVENPDIADCYNTCLKIAKKRASVDAVLTATAASDIFAQDLEDLHHEPAAEETRPAPRQQPRGGQHSSPPPDEPKARKPLTGAGLYEHLCAKDRELASNGIIERGALLAYAVGEAQALKYPHNMSDWTHQQALVVAGLVKAWIERESAPEGEPEEGYAGKEIEEPAAT